MTNTAQKIQTSYEELLEIVRAFESYLVDDSRSERRRQVCLEQCRAALAKVHS